MSKPGRAPPGPVVSIGQDSRAGRKDRNDDSFGVLVPRMPLLASKGIAMAIADGMSASAGAKEASECCVKTFLEDYYCTHETWTVRKSVAAVLKATNAWLHAQGQARHDSDQGMASTFSGVVLRAGMAHVFHVGDTRIARLRGGSVEPLTQDHRARVAGASYLARAMGVGANLELDYRAEPALPDDIFIFTTDGVHDHVPPARMARLIASADLGAAAAAILDAAMDRGSTDNITCQLVRVESTGEIDAATHLASLSGLPFPPELDRGMRFDGYAIQRVLHMSNRTQIYLALDIATSTTVVLKTPSRNFEDDPGYLEMFAREERIGRLVASPHVLAVIPPTRERRALYYVTEFFDGQTLRQWMRTHPGPDLATVRAIVAQIAAGLRAFHRKQVLHLDLKPENIMVDAVGQVKIIDFGSARAAGWESDDARPPTPRGTLGYTAPELLLGAAPDSRADIYAVGVIAYEMLTGHLPYGAGFATARDVQRLHYVDATAIRPDLPRWVDDALAHAVAKRPGQRTEVSSELLANLEHANPSLSRERSSPLSTRNPLRFWQVVALGFALSSLVLAMRLISR